MPESAPQTTSVPPLIVISYSKEEEKWKDQLVSLFPTDIELRLVLNRVEDFPGRVDDELRLALREAKVLVLMLSPTYLGNSWITGDEGDLLLQLESERSVRVLPVFLRFCSWQEIPFFRNRSRQLITSDGKPIAEASPAEQTTALENLASRVLQLAGVGPSETSSATTESPTATAGKKARLTIKELEKFKTSEEVAKVLAQARVLATLREKPLVTTSCLLFGLAETGRPKSEYRRTPQFLWEQLTKRKNRYDAAYKEKFPRAKNESYLSSASEVGLVTENVIRVFELALEISVQTYKPKPQSSDDESSFTPDTGRIGARHLLAALLSLNLSGAHDVLTTIGDISVLRSNFLEFIIESLPEDDHDAWRKILGVKPKQKPAVTRQKKSTKGVVQGNVEAEASIVQQTVVFESPASAPSEGAAAPDLPPPAMPDLGGGSFEAPTLPNQDLTNVATATETSTATPTDPPQADKSPQPAPEVDYAKPDEQESEAAELADLKPILAGFATDYWSGKDLLNIEDDVNALASLVSAWSVEPPLSIGLFGDWGSGKSHFMRQMRERVEKLSRKARKATDKKQNEIGYYKNIVQIEFNAWHYIEGNLWASLVDHIFANLRITEKEKLDLVEARRDDLMNKLGVKKEIESKLKSKIEERKTQLKTKQKVATDLAKEAGEKKTTATEALAGFRDEVKENLDQLELPIAFSKDDKDLLGRLGIQSSDLQTAGDVRTQYNQVKSGGTRLLAQWNLFYKDPRRWAVAGCALLVLAAGFLLQKAQLVDALPAWLGSILVSLLPIYAGIKPALDQYKKGVRTLEEKDRAIELERQRRMAELQGEVSALTKTVMEAESAADSIQNEIADLDQQIKTTTTSKILAEFIEDRAAASDYRRHLGLLALIRRDFEKLRDLFDQQRREEKEGQETHDQNRINRIILYIDDLDRCPPQRVVEVLQAIHLLLAFPIFVVVVGVDARWVTRSLQESYEWLRLEEDEDKKKKSDDDADEPGEQGATPHDYLEKIFQIPFWLAPMEETQCKTFIEGLTEQVRYREPAESSEVVNKDASGTKNADTATQSGQVNLEGELTDQTDVAAGNGHPDADKHPVNALENLENGKDARDVLLRNGDSSQPAEDPLATDSGLAVVEPERAQDDISDLSSADGGSTTEESSGHVDETASRKNETDEGEHHEEELIDLSPHSLTLGDEEIEYMTSLAKLIGRSPRAVKRFLNCYRLIKVSLPPAKLKKFVQDGASYEYRAVMILLGIVTGAPTASLYVIEEIENWKPENKNPTMIDFVNQLEKNSDLRSTPDWARLNSFLAALDTTQGSAAMFAAMKDVTPRVSRFSFRIARAEAAGPKRVSTAPQSKPKGPQQAGPIA